MVQIFVKVDGCKAFPLRVALSDEVSQFAKSESEQRV